MNKLKVRYQNRVYEVNPLTTAQEFINEFQLKVKDPMAVVINGYFTRMNEKIRVDSSISFLELASSQGKRVYESSVLFVLLAVFYKRYPNLRAFIQHSIHKGIYVEIDGGELSEEQILEMEKNVKELAERDLPINRISQDWDVSLQEMQELQRQDMVNLYRYYSPSTFKFYEFDGFKENLHLPLLPTTKTLKHFALKKYRDGIVVIFPEFQESPEIPEFVDRPKLFRSYQEYAGWTRILKVRTVGQLNRYIMNGQIEDLVKVSEAFHEKRVAQIADQITKKERPARLALIAGPSSSGKTTFSKRLGIQLRVNGFRPVAISMDNYFLDRDKTPRDADGNFDFERVDALDVPLFMDHMSKLIAGEEVQLPKFDFHSGTKKITGEILKLEKDQIIIIEGIHGLNPRLTGHIDPNDKFKIYIAPLTQLSLHRHDRIPASDTRLLRRIVRDNYFRGYPAAETLNRWRSVRHGEKQYIFPLQEEADAIFNSAIFYELSILKFHA